MQLIAKHSLECSSDGKSSPYQANFSSILLSFEVKKLRSNTEAHLSGEIKVLHNYQDRFRF